MSDRKSSLEDQSTYSKCKRLLSEEEYKEALSLANGISTPAFRATILIDGGFGVRKASPIREGIQLLENVLEDETSPPSYSRASLLYNIANGYYALFMLRRLKGRKTLVPPNDDDLRVAKSRYRDALSELGNEPSSFRTQLWVNYGNCLSQFGRGIEAIQCYKNALKEDPQNGMASGNLGIELRHVARITGRYRHDYALEAHSALSAALGPQMHLEYGGLDARRAFQRAKAELDAFIDAHGGKLTPSKPIGLSSRRVLTGRYIRFCQANSLFLNAWVGDQDRSPALTDEIFFGPITTPYSDNETVPELLRILNEIKESYTAARYLYFVSQEKSPVLDDLSALTSYFHADTMKDLNGLYFGILKSSYARAFDVLDKVARIINVYFGIGKRKDSFWNVLAVRQSRGQTCEIRFIARPQVVSTNNYGLYALADVCTDYFESHHVDFKTIDEVRNWITHDFLSILPDGEVANSPMEVPYSEFKQQTVNVLRLAKYAILYAVSAINIGEAQKPEAGRVQVVEYTYSAGLPGEIVSERPNAQQRAAGA